MKIRKATPDDSMKISLLEEEIFPDPWSYRDVLTTISSNGALCFVATSDEGELLAYVIGRCIMPEGEIYRIATKPEYRKRGIAYRLLDFAIKTARGAGLESVFLEVRESNVAARNLYRAYGFSEIGVRKNYYKEPVENAVLMMKTDSLTI